MSEFILYWPEQNYLISTLNKSDVRRKMLERAENNQWIYWEKEVYYVRRYSADWIRADEEPFLFIKMERDYLYKIKNMASGMGTGGTLLVLPDRQSLFSADGMEQDLLAGLVKNRIRKPSNWLLTTKNTRLSNQEPYKTGLNSSPIIP